MSEIFDRRSRGVLSLTEEAELESLVTTWGCRLNERRLREFAEQRGISIEDARRECDDDLKRAVEWWQSFEASTDRRRAVAAQVRRRWQSIR